MPYEQKDYLGDYLKKYSPDLGESLYKINRFDEFTNELQQISSGRGFGKPVGVLSNVLDVLSRGSYGTAKAADVLINEEGDVLSKAWRAIKEGVMEVVSPDERLSFTDVINTANPVWAATHRKEAEFLGFLGDVVIDPINLFSFGAGGVLKGAVRIAGKGGKLIPLSKPGLQVFEKLAAEIGEEGLEGVARHSATSQVFQELLNPGITNKIDSADLKAAKQSQSRLLKSNISKLSEGISEKAGVFTTDFQSMLDMFSGKGAKSLLSPGEIEKVKARIKAGDEGAEAIFDSIVKGSPKVEVSPIKGVPYLDEIISYGKGEGRRIGVVVPQRYINGQTISKDKVGVNKLFASATIDPQDLRFITADSEQVMTFGQLRNHIGSRIEQEAIEAKLLTGRIDKGKQILGDINPDDLVDQGGLKILGKTAVSTEQFKNFARALRLPQVLKTVKDLPGIKELGIAAKGIKETFGLNQILERDYPEWMRFRRNIEVQRHSALETVEKAYLDIFNVPGQSGVRVLNKEEREGVTQFLSSVQKETKVRIEALGLKNPSIEFGQKVFKDLLNASTLSVEQKAAIVKLQASHNEMFRLEREAGLTHDYYVNYNPIRYEAINSAKKYIELRRFQTGEAIKGTDTFVQPKDFTTIEEALAAGYQPIKDAGRLYALRYLEHNAALRRQEWSTFIKSAYPNGKIPKIIDQDLLRLGEKYYAPRYGEAGKLAVELFDFVNGMFRKSATVVRPAFTGKQIIGNSGQIFAEMGTDALKVFDPTVFGDAVNIVAGQGDKLRGISDVFGVKYTGQELLDLTKQYPVRKNVAIENIGFVTEGQVVQKLTSDLYTSKMGNELAGSKAMAGMQNLFNKGSYYLQIPAFTEDIFRIGAFIGAIKAGNSPAAAMEVVDKALFNYTSGLTHAEQVIRKTIVPFYSFQRFGTELLVRALGQHPARLAVGAKGIQQFYESWNKIAGGEELTENERSVVAPYILEQPSTFEKFDKQGLAIFRTFNNLTFLDVMNSLHLDEDGSLNLNETLMKGALSQLAPFWKVPLETLIFKRQLFTDKPLEGVYSGRVGNLDYDKFITNLGVMSGLHGGAVTGAIGGALGGIARFGPIEDQIKSMIGWEEGTTKAGQRYVRVNPYLLNVTTSMLPALNTAIRISNQDNTFWDNVLYGSFGIGASRLDLKQEGIKKAISAKQAYKDKLYEYRTYMREGRINAADMAREDLMELLEYNQQEASKWLDPNIRGRKLNNDGNIQ